MTLLLNSTLEAVEWQARTPCWAKTVSHPFARQCSCLPASPVWTPNQMMGHQFQGKDTSSVVPVVMVIVSIVHLPFSSVEAFALSG
ncbi:MAG: hypothetical protein Q4D96_12655 [Propionibacteriaceae bacterium]|nr:hypothetical protein [Propionibacteriaceae bacterium]